MHSLGRKMLWIDTFVTMSGNGFICGASVECPLSEIFQVHIVIKYGSIDMVKLKTVSGIFRHSESKSGLSFWLTLFLTWALSTFCANPQCFLMVFCKTLCKTRPALSSGFFGMEG